MHDVPLIMLMAVGMGFALLFGLATNKLRLSPIVGYLIAGIAIGPHTPGYQGDLTIAGQLAEIGVILLMFGVGLHFNLEELFRVRVIATVGAIVQSSAAILFSLLLVPFFGFSISTALVLGTAISVASTVVLIRVLTDNGSLHTPQGHVAVGWLIVEDLLTVAVLVLLPSIAKAGDADTGGGAIMVSIGKTAISIVLALVVILVLGKKLFPYVMNVVARTRSRELFTLSVLVVAMLVAVLAAKVFGVSMALGAFLAGLVVAQSDVGHEAAAEALPFRDAFAVLFFVSVGMLFDPATLYDYPGLTAAVVAIVVIGKPLAAFAIVLILNHPLRTALTVALALGQVGEFTFILADVAHKLGFFESEHSSVLVTASIISITLNPLLFRLLPKLETAIPRLPVVGAFLGSRGKSEALKQLTVHDSDKEGPGAIVIGYGPVGQAVMKGLDHSGVSTLIIDMNIDTVKKLREQGRAAVYGDAQRADILAAAGAATARYLVLTVPDVETRNGTIKAVREINPDIQILARTRYLSEEASLQSKGITVIACEEAEVSAKLLDRVIHMVKVSGIQPLPAVTPEG